MNARKLLSAAKAVEAAYIEDVFSTYLYTGNGSTQTITNEIDLSGKGGLVWWKKRSGVSENDVRDTIRGVGQRLITNRTDASASIGGVSSFNNNGFTVTGINDSTNATGDTYVSWTFRKQPKFFDVVTYTGNGVAGLTVNHNLGSVPGMIVVKNTSGISNWAVYHRSMANTDVLLLNTTDAKITSNNTWNSTTPTATTFQVGIGSAVNNSGDSYVAYLFAHDAGGFGASGSDNVITCGSYTGNGSATGPTVTLGYEPQWLLVKNATTGATSWTLVDNMRGLTVGGVDPVLQPNSADAELSSSSYNWFSPTATGFQVTTSDAWVNTSTNTYIYIAIRRGPMKTPTTGTSVYNAIARTGTGAAATVSGVGFAPDYLLHKPRPGGTDGFAWDKLRGPTQYIRPNLTNAEGTSSAGFDLISFNMDGISCGPNSATGLNVNTVTEIDYFFRRAPGFFDEVCYTGTGSATTVTHNLGVAPGIIISKSRSNSSSWAVYHAALGATKYMEMENTQAASTSSVVWNDTSPTVANFSVGVSAATNASGYTYVAYLFATCLGVSKVGSYTGTGNTLQIDCGFTGGARFVLIKRTDSTGDWYVWDSARGIVAGNDPYLLLNSTAAEVTTTDWVDTHSPGFELSSAVGNNANISTASYIFLAIA